MSDIILKAENISKQYRLGLIGTGTLSHDLNRWWYRIRGKEDPFLKVGSVNDRSVKDDSDYAWALKDINFEVKRGEVLGIIGKNGAGKSTLLKILSRVTSPTTGEIKTKGRIASLLEVGTGFHPELTGLENIYLNGAILGMTKTEIKAKEEEIVEFSGCQRYVDTPVKRYSSGMRVRLAFAVAAHLEPDILVIDEVLAVGDAEFQKKAIGKMQDISKGEGRTVLFVSHNMAAVKNLCSRILVLEHGEIKFEGDTGEGINFYLDNNIKFQETSIIDRTDREGSQKMKLKNLLLINDRGKVVQDLFCGEYLKVKIELEKFSFLDFSKLIVSVAFIDSKDNIALAYVSDEMNYKFDDLANSDSFDLTIPNLYLGPGIYRLRFLMTENDTSPFSFLDYIENIRIINVLAGDLWNTGKTNRVDRLVILPGSFNVT